MTKFLQQIWYDNYRGDAKVKKLMIVIALFLLSCNYADLEAEHTETQPVDAYAEVAPHYEEIEELLAQVELEVGLGSLTTASSFFAELMAIVHGHEVTNHQQARINTMAELLSDILANDDDERIFSGSDAAAKVMNLIGAAPAGYTFVYHQIPSFVGSDGLGYYVFLVPADYDETSEMEIRKTFFVTESGEILTFE